MSESVVRLPYAEFQDLKESMARYEATMVRHMEEDRIHFQRTGERLNQVELDQQKMHGSLEFIKDGQLVLFQRFGVSPDPVTGKKRKTVALMGQKGLIWTILGSMGGMLVVYKILFTAWPFFFEFLKALARVH